MEGQNLTIYQKTILFHYSYIESKLFRNRCLLMFLSGLILALVASSGVQWYNVGVIPQISTCAVLGASMLISWYITFTNKTLSMASIFLIEMHTRIFMVQKLLDQFAGDDADSKHMTILESEMKLIESEFRKRFKHTVKQ